MTAIRTAAAVFQCLIGFSSSMSAGSRASLWVFLNDPVDFLLVGDPGGVQFLDQDSDRVRGAESKYPQPLRKGALAGHQLLAALRQERESETR